MLLYRRMLKVSLVALVRPNREILQMMEREPRFIAIIKKRHFIKAIFEMPITANSPVHNTVYEITFASVGVRLFVSCLANTAVSSVGIETTGSCIITIIRFFSQAFIDVYGANIRF